MTVFLQGRLVADPISIHTLRVEGDPLAAGGHVRGGISIHTLRVEGDGFMAPLDSSLDISIHTLRVEGDRYARDLGRGPNYFNPHPPRGG